MAEQISGPYLTSGASIITVGVLGLIGNLSAVIFPILVGCLIDSGLSSRNVGYVESADLTGIAAGALLWSRLILRVNWRHAAGCAIPLAVAGNLLCILFPNFGTVIFGRLLSGLGSGLLCAIGSSSLALTRRPDRTFGLMSTFNMTASAVLVYVFTFVGHRGGSVAVLGGVAILIASLFPFLKLVPARSPRSGARPEATVPQDPGPRKIPWVSGGLALTAIWSYFVAALVFWTYAERVAVHAGFSTSFTARSLGFGQIMGACGALATAVMASFSDRRLPPVVVYLASAICAATLLTIPTYPLAFVAAICMLFFSWGGIYPYFIGTIVTLDPTARLVSVMITLSFLGKAMAPPIASALVRGADYRVVYVFAAATFAVSLALLIPPLLRADRSLSPHASKRGAHSGVAAQAGSDGGPAELTASRRT